MQDKPIISIIIGTRPEAIKLAPVIISFNDCKKFHTRIILTGQHKEIVLKVMELFSLESNINLDLMKKNQSLTYISCKILEGLKKEFQKYHPSLVLVQGDTTTAFISALAAFYEKIPIGHVEAGLRTNDIFDPYPEEANRRLISQIATLHFCPTKCSELNLLNSGIKKNIYLTGNTVIDSILYVADKAKPKNIFEHIDWENNRIILVTVHRRENWGENLHKISLGIKKILNKYQDCIVIFPLHPNKIVRDVFIKSLGDNSRVFLTEPLQYDELVFVIKKCYFLITDSGGLQEEAPSLGKPVLVVRENTERPEAIIAGTSKLVGTEPNNIFNEANHLLSNKTYYLKMSKAINPFGDGKASKRILSACCEFLGL